MQVDCQDFLSTSLMQVVSALASAILKISSEVASSLIFTDLMQLDEANRLDDQLVASW